MGTGSSALGLIDVAGANGKTVTFDNDGVYANQLNFSDDGKVVLDSSNFTGAVTTSSNGKGTLQLKGATVTGDIGTSNNKLAKLQVENSTTIDGLIHTNQFYVYFSDPITFSNTSSSTILVDLGDVFFGSHNASLVFEDNVDLNVTSTSANSNNGSFTFEGNSVINGSLGQDMGNNYVDKINAGADGKTVIFENDVYANTLTFLGNGTVIFADAANFATSITTALSSTLDIGTNTVTTGTYSHIDGSTLGISIDVTNTGQISANTISFNDSKDNTIDVTVKKNGFLKNGYKILILNDNDAVSTGNSITPYQSTVIETDSVVYSFTGGTENGDHYLITERKGLDTFSSRSNLVVLRAVFERAIETDSSLSSDLSNHLIALENLYHPKRS